jgi:hypothetical protein
MKRSQPLARKSPIKRGEPLRAKSPMRRKSRKRSTPAQAAARGQKCLLNVSGVCNYNSETVVLVHFRWLGDCGCGIKPTDEQGCPACSACNAWTDSPTPRQARDRLQYESDRNFYAARALVRLRHLEKAA